MGDATSQLYGIMVALAEQPTPEHLLVQKMVLKIFYRAVEVSRLAQGDWHQPPRSTSFLPCSATRRCLRTGCR